MKNQNFYMRVISLLLVVLAVLFYNSSMKAQANEKEISTRDIPCIAYFISNAQPLPAENKEVKMC